MSTRSRLLRRKASDYYIEALDCLPSSADAATRQSLRELTLASEKSMLYSTTKIGLWAQYIHQGEYQKAREMFWSDSITYGTFSPHITQYQMICISRNEAVYLDEWGLPLTEPT